MSARVARFTVMLGFWAAIGCAFSGKAASDDWVATQSSAYNAQVRDGFRRVRVATAPYVTLDSAVVAGYARDVPRCFDDPHHGAMGFHHLNRAHVDATIEVEKPEILLYERRADGTYALNGVEYIIPYTRWPRDSVPPQIFGMDLKREENLKLWYMHMWVWTENRAGLFADYNPAVKCPEGTTGKGD
jgi:hypothetical protein